MTTISDNDIMGLVKRKEEMKMKITKKLAKEIFMGNFSNVNFDELTKDNKGKVNRFESLEKIEQLYKETLDLPLLKKDFDGLRTMELVKLPNEDYKRSKGHLQTDVLVLQRTIYGYMFFVYRDDSKSYEKHLKMILDEQIKKCIIYRLINNLKTSLF